MRPIDIVPLPEFGSLPCENSEHLWQPITNYGIVTEFLICDHCGAIATDADQLEEVQT
jgi:hypothetical protein